MLANLWRRYAAGVFVALASVAFAYSLWEAKNLVMAKDEFYANLAHVHVSPPHGMPPLTRQSLYQAIVIFNIQIPKNADFPVYDPQLADRGLTALDPWEKKFHVKIGPTAFQSWGLLGSTLAHEFEVHCRQNFGFIQLQDMVGMEGTAQAERQAYRYEVAQADRFGLTAEERDMIRETMEYYYPENMRSPRLAASLRKSFGQWVDTQLLANALSFDRIPSDQ